MSWRPNQTGGVALQGRTVVHLLVSLTSIGVAAFWGSNTSTTQASVGPWLGVTKAPTECYGTLTFSGSGGALTPERAMTASGYPTENLQKESLEPRTVIFFEPSIGGRQVAFSVIRGQDGWLVASVVRAQACDALGMPELQLGPRRGSPNR